MVAHLANICLTSSSPIEITMYLYIHKLYSILGLKTLAAQQERSMHLTSCQSFVQTWWNTQSKEAVPILKTYSMKMYLWWTKRVTIAVMRHRDIAF